jgi:hypothetical protein
MAGTIICDYIRTDANKLSLNVGNTTFATINAMGLLSNTGTQIIDQNGAIGTNTVVTTSIQDGAISTAKIATSAITVPKIGFSNGIIQHYAQYITQGSVATYNDSYFNAPTSGTTNQHSSYTITPVGNNSKFVFNLVASVDADGGSTGSGEFICLFVGTTLIGCSYAYRRVNGSETRVHKIIAPYTHTGSSSFTLSLRVKSSQSYNLYFNRMSSGTSNDKSAYFETFEMVP